jgi:hypothetical protein
MPEHPKYRLDIAARIRLLWCGMMHDAPMWPIHGSYKCRACGQSYRVPWAGERLLQPALLVIESAVESGA